MTWDCFDIGIVGAGPAGSSAAILLARKGYSVVLVDKSKFPRDKLCGDFLNPINWPLFEQLGVTEDLLELEHEEITGFRISCYTGEEASFPFSGRNGKVLFGLGLKRLHFDDLLLKAAKREGVVVLEGRKLKALGRQGDRWSMTVANPAGADTLQTRFLIGADGRNSMVAQRLGLAHASSSGGNSFVGYQLHLAGVQGINRDIQIHLFPGGYAGLGGVGGGVTNLCFSLERQKVKNHSCMESILEHCLYKNPRLKEALGKSVKLGGSQTTYPVFTPRRRSSGDGFVLVGDAAYGPEPVTGEGVYFALKSSELASKAIHQAFILGDLSAKQTLRYEISCKESLSWRERLNTLNRGLAYHPSLLRYLVRLSSWTSLPIKPMVQLVVTNGSQPRSVEC
ncbi:MAG: NAD(P)-binding protein [Deltaproteobacteria bacterium]|nr:NAD(P)-binding protein [Deltaproteobacteria bacterium]